MTLIEKGTKVVIVMGSEHDEKKVQPAIDVLKSLHILYDVNIISAHRTPKLVENLVKSVDEFGDSVEVYIAAAGMAAALPGAIAALTIKPVIGLPLSGEILHGIDAVLSMLQLPSGVPIATVGIDNAKNAALLAAEIIALHDKSVRDALWKNRAGQTEAIVLANKRRKEKEDDKKL